MDTKKILNDFVIEEPSLRVGETQSSENGWLTTGIVSFRVKGYPAGENAVLFRAANDVYGEAGGIRAGDIEGASIQLGFAKASSPKDAYKQAAEQLKEIAELLLNKANELLT